MTRNQWTHGTNWNYLLICFNNSYSKMQSSDFDILESQPHVVSMAVPKVIYVHRTISEKTTIIRHGQENNDLWQPTTYVKSNSNFKSGNYKTKIQQCQSLNFKRLESTTLTNRLVAVDVHMNSSLHLVRFSSISKQVYIFISQDLRSTSPFFQVSQVPIVPRP